MITQAQLQIRLDYDEITGIFTWYRTNKRAGRVNKDGYRDITFDKKTYSAHRLAWLYKFGILPNSFIDHKNTNRDDNWISNLRLATRSENRINVNSKINSNNKHGHRGICARIHKGNTKFYAYIGKNGKREYLGLFDKLEEAIESRKLAEKRLYGEFAPN